MVNATPEFREHPKVINGCSELFAKVWGPELGVRAAQTAQLTLLTVEFGREGCFQYA